MSTGPETASGSLPEPEDARPTDADAPPDPELLTDDGVTAGPERDAGADEAAASVAQGAASGPHHGATLAADFVPPRTAGAAGVLGVALSLVLLAVGGVALHDGLVLVGAIGGDQWTTTATEAVGTVTPTTVVAWVGAGLAVVGLVLLVAAVVPRRRFGLRLRGDGGLYVREVDVARIASGAARSTGTVLEATSAASRRRVVVRARTTIDRDAGALAHAAVTERLSVLREPPKVVVHARRPR